MKLEAGKKYRLRNGSVEKCLAVWCEEVQGYQATVTFHPYGAVDYTLDGKYYSGGEEFPYDIVAEYKEPKKFEAWVNLDSDGYAYFWKTKEDADKCAHLSRVECRKIEWEVPDER